MLLRVLHHAHTARPLLDSVPDFQQTAFPIFAPLVIPKPQCRDALLRQEFLACGVTLHSFGMTVLRAIQFHGQLRVGTVEIQNIIPDRMLPAKFETGETPAAQRPPERPFVVRLIATQLTGNLFQAHRGMMLFVWKITSPSPRSSPRFGGERRNPAARNGCVMPECQCPALSDSLSSPNEERAGVRRKITAGMRSFYFEKLNAPHLVPLPVLTGRRGTQRRAMNV